MSAYATLAKNARADSVTTYAGTGAKLSIWTTAYGSRNKSITII